MGSESSKIGKKVMRLGGIKCVHSSRFFSSLFLLSNSKVKNEKAKTHLNKSSLTTYMGKNVRKIKSPRKIQRVPQAIHGEQSHPRSPN